LLEPYAVKVARTVLRGGKSARTYLSQQKITFTKINNWQEIPWKEIMIIVRDLQNKIVKATL